MRCENKTFLQNDPGFLQEISSTAVEVGLVTDWQEAQAEKRGVGQTLAPRLLAATRGLAG